MHAIIQYNFFSFQNKRHQIIPLRENEAVMFYAVVLSPHLVFDLNIKPQIMLQYQGKTRFLVQSNLQHRSIIVRELRQIMHEVKR